MIYMDNAATTQISKPVLQAMMPYLMEQFGNASSPYGLGAKAREGVEQARRYVAELINAEPEEIYFTSGGSEANNWAIKGLWFDEMGNLISNDLIVTSQIEHPSIMRTCDNIVYTHGAKMIYLPVDKSGTFIVRLFENYDMESALMASVMFANNEIGTIQPIQEIGEVCKERGMLFHTDAVQAFGQIPIDVKSMGIDLLSASGHKIHAPKGVGCLYIRNGTSIQPLIHGGHQEYGMRAGTENVAAIVGFGEAAHQAAMTMRYNSAKMIAMRDYIMTMLTTEITDCFINGDRKNRLPNNISITFNGVDAESLVLMLSGLKNPIYISAGSACTSGLMTPSRVLKAIGLSDEQAYGTVRLSIDETLSFEEANYAIEEIKNCVGKLRTM